MASYRKAIEWIAENDEPGETSNEVMAGYATVQLVAELWNKPISVVAIAVVLKRQE